MDVKNGRISFSQGKVEELFVQCDMVIPKITKQVTLYRLNWLYLGIQNCMYMYVYYDN